LESSGARVAADSFPIPGQPVDDAGLYSWWVDREGAEDLTHGLGTPVHDGLIYAGQTGASVGVGTSEATLRRRILNNHLRGNVRGSTFRWTLAAALHGGVGLRAVGPRRLDSDSEALLSAWMRGHLAVAVVSFPDRAALDVIETDVLARLDPPLNLANMPPSVLRARLTHLRSGLGREPDTSGVGRLQDGPVLASSTSVTGGFTPETLAADLGLANAKSLRAFLRANFPRSAEPHSTRWGALTAEQEAAVRERFRPRR
jgi:hypothetical protein